MFSLRTTTLLTPPPQQHHHRLHARRLWAVHSGATVLHRSRPYNTDMPRDTREYDSIVCHTRLFLCDSLATDYYDRSGTSATTASRRSQPRTSLSCHCCLCCAYLHHLSPRSHCTCIRVIESNPLTIIEAGVFSYLTSLGQL